MSQAELNQLMHKIEELRKIMYSVAKEDDLSNADLLAASQKLDAALNEYYRLLKKKCSE